MLLRATAFFCDCHFKQFVFHPTLSVFTILWKFAVVKVCEREWEKEICEYPCFCTISINISFTTICVSAVSKLTSNFGLILMFDIYITKFLISNFCTCILRESLLFSYSSLPSINIDSKIGGFAAYIFYIWTFKCLTLWALIIEKPYLQACH